MDDKVIIDLSRKATADARAAVARTADLLGDQHSRAMVYLYAAGVLIAEAGGRFAASHGASKEESTDAVLEILRELMSDRDGFFAKLEAAQGGTVDERNDQQ